MRFLPYAATTRPSAALDSIIVERTILRSRLVEISLAGLIFFWIGWQVAAGV